VSTHSCAPGGTEPSRDSLEPKGSPPLSGATSGTPSSGRNSTTRGLSLLWHWRSETVDCSHCCSCTVYWSCSIFGWLWTSIKHLF